MGVNQRQKPGNSGAKKQTSRGRKCLVKVLTAVNYSSLVWSSMEELSHLPKPNTVSEETDFDQWEAGQTAAVVLVRHHYHRHTHTQGGHKC